MDCVKSVSEPQSAEEPHSALKPEVTAPLSRELGTIRMRRRVTCCAISNKVWF
jgi:hypothetical protein